MPPRDENPTVGEMLSELLDLLTGLGVMLLPVMILAVPCLILLLPLALLAIPPALLAVPVLLIRALRRRRLSSGAGRPRPSARTAAPLRSRWRSRRCVEARPCEGVWRPLPKAP